ncbi:pirin family protein [Saccharopolyspora rhizosphaerae]|uniref:Pirin family protein n=1 Tax=Saccharopolyspora rhizosphaerae TaxID=2492662 RepID=A0A3R8PAN3_9PSEU|nr:pirin family protein [Saccharopolyspora rhizosphaerae]RRO20461.1 pirin family protein [Saccharopolyspora rhizosphaerae]
MSNVESRPDELRCGGVATAAPGPELLRPREVPLGGPRAMLVGRTLPNRHRRMVGAWCFADFYGPADITGQPGMQVPPHPHTGLQTVSWLLDGQVLHCDSVGSTQLVEPGRLSLMTAGRGIAHSEESPADHSAVLHGVQLWIALPGEERGVAPHFEHHADLPVISTPEGTATVLVGSLLGGTSPATTYSALVGAELSVHPGTTMVIPVEAHFEHAVLALWDITVDGHEVSTGDMLYVGSGRDAVTITAAGRGRAMLLGGVPFEEQIVMWWNFVGRSHEEVAEARAEWERNRRALDEPGRFGVVHGHHAPPLPAPALPNAALRARGRTRDRP